MVEGMKKRQVGTTVARDGSPQHGSTKIRFSLRWILLGVTLLALVLGWLANRWYPRWLDPPISAPLAEVTPYAITQADLLFPRNALATPTEQLAYRRQVIEERIYDLKKKGDDENAQTMQAELDAILDGDWIGNTQSEDASPRLHVVSMNGADSSGNDEVDVVVSDLGGPVVLCVCARERLKWKIELEEGVELRRVIAGGLRPQIIEGVRDGVVIEGQTTSGVNPDYAFFRFGDGRFTGSLESSVRRIVGMEPATMQYGYEVSGRPFVVGPSSSRWGIECEEWTTQMQVHLLDDLYRSSMKPRAMEVAKKLVGHTFPVVLVNRQDRLGGGTSTVAAASIFGPYVSTMQPTMRPVAGLAYDSEGPTLLSLLQSHVQTSPTSFVAHSGSLVGVDCESGELTPFNVNGFSGSALNSTMAYDTDHERVYVWGQRELLSIDVYARKITVHREDNPGVHAITYSPGGQCLIAVVGGGSRLSRGPISEIRRYNLRGAEIERVPIRGQIPSAGNSGRPMLVEIDNYLVVMPDVAEDAYMRPIPVDRTYVLDPGTGEIVLVCVRKPR